MSILAAVAAGVETAFRAAGDAVLQVTYVRRSGAPAYDPVTDSVTVSQQTMTVRALRSRITDVEREASPVTVEDSRILVPASDMAPATPKESDTYTLDGVQYNVIGWRGVPGDSLWIITGRRR